jgi:hypothetical protein
MAIKHLFIVLILGLCGCTTNNFTREDFGAYDLVNPNSIDVLPKILMEVSGLSNIDNNTFACIQDEKGMLFICDLLGRKIKQEYHFGYDGDYEGIAKVNEDIYILRSDGMIFKVSDFQKPDFKVDSFRTHIPATNNEGMCYDKEHNRLLIGSKGKIGGGSVYKDLRAIYTFDLKTNLLEQLFTIDVQDLKVFAIKHNIKLQSESKKKRNVNEPIIKFMTSEIAIHPFSKKLYLLSAKDYLFFIFNMNGEVEHIEALNPKVFNKAEGMTFLDNGDLLISNEGQNKRPSLLRFDYHIK